MAELRDQMKFKSTKLQNEYKDLSHGINAKTDEAKLKAMETQHKERIGIASDTFRFFVLFVALNVKFLVKLKTRKNVGKICTNRKWRKNIKKLKKN